MPGLYNIYNTPKGIMKHKVAEPYAKVTYIHKDKVEEVEFPQVKKFPTDLHWFLLGGAGGILVGVILKALW